MVSERDDNEDVAWLLARERGQPGPTASAATTARYARLQSLIADLPATPAGATAHKGWRQGILAAIDAADAAPEASSDLPPARSMARSTARLTIDRAAPERTSTRPRRRAAIMASFAMAAVAVILFTVYRYRGEPVAGPRLAFEVEPADHRHRSADPSVGDKLIVRASVEGQAELRIYDATGVERARCTGPAPDCTVDRSGQRTTLRLVMPLRVPGALRAVLFAAPLGGPSRGLNGDVEAAVRAGIAVTTLEPLGVH